MTTRNGVRTLVLADIADLRAYERARDALRARVIELKRRRRVALGPVISIVFENRETVRFQIQEMARAEKLIRDEQIQAELDVYNVLVPEPGELSATVFLELTSEGLLREWLSRLVGIERALELRIGSGDDAEVVRCKPEQRHEEALTREDVTSSVHYVRFSLGTAQVERFAKAPVALASTHPNYLFETALSAETMEELLTDLMP